MIEIVRSGIATTFQDLGRPGFAHVGVGHSGVVDPDGAALVNRLVGNTSRAVVIETCGDFEVVALDHVTMASTDELAPVRLTAGQRLSVRPGAHGRLWHYVALRGGFDLPVVLGSASFDTLAGLGPPPPEPGRRLAAGTSTDTAAGVDQAPRREVGHVARVLPGPRRNWFTDDSWETLITATWTVTTSNRVGVRMSGGSIERSIRRELPSEGLVRGAIQVPPDGDPVMMLADHPTTGGYPVIAVVHQDDVALVAQHSAGASVRLRHYV
jgi:biotin-dependent carboxylase-like uncharacterized protein